ncbi:hypothetical protein GGR50DRAFT_657091 [Xylaria sp. CBS 124048]|nr:hypothetical protein GGR50DRAFT_657091 [Xylaria sp. CBS 124048]
MSTGTELGPLVRRWGLPVKQLPAATASIDELKPFIASILKEALPFIESATSADAKKLWMSKGSKSSPESTAKVEVLERVVSARELQAVAAKHGVKSRVEAETWAARLSVHEDAAKKGTASWEEFERAFRLEHGKSEMAFTPNVIGANEAQRWDCAGLEEVEVAGQSWEKFSLVVEEMRHKVGRPVLKDRTFPVLQLSCAAKQETSGKPAFVIVSIPVPDFGTSEKANLAKQKGAQIAFYVSVERIRKLDDGRIEWLLGTASDAAGVLPLWIQDKAISGIVWKDVPLFLGWIAKERGKSAKKGSVPAVPAVPDVKKETEPEAQVTTGVVTGPTAAVSEGDIVKETEETPQVTTGVATGPTAAVSEGKAVEKTEEAPVATAEATADPIASAPEEKAAATGPAASVSEGDVVKEIAEPPVKTAVAAEPSALVSEEKVAEAKQAPQVTTETATEPSASASEGKADEKTEKETPATIGAATTETSAPAPENDAVMKTAAAEVEKPAEQSAGGKGVEGAESITKN